METGAAARQEQAEKPVTFISVVMPALNEEDNILPAVEDTLAAFDHFGIDGEIIVVNDGSTDRTPVLVAEKGEADARVRLINHVERQGIGASFWDGVYQAKGQFVTMFPGDNENDPFECLRYCSLLEHVDLIIPFAYNKEVRPAYRNFLSLVYRLIINMTFKVNFNYTNGTILYRRSILTDLIHHSRGFFFQTEILIKAVKRGYLFAEVPYHLDRRNSGVSKAVSFPSFYNVVKGYLRLAWDYYFSGKSAKGVLPLSSESASSRRFTLAKQGRNNGHDRP
jgi:glycosyltransferase involved in cell wall biosynthesis